MSGSKQMIDATPTPAVLSAPAVAAPRWTCLDCGAPLSTARARRCRQHATQQRQRTAPPATRFTVERARAAGRQSAANRRELERLARLARAHNLG